MSERKNIIQPVMWWRAFETEAKRRGVTLAAFCGGAMRDALPPEVAAGLPARRGRGKPPKEVTGTPQ